ncbi:hypothetical protein D3C86_1965830 [compost metagenome]
MDAGLMREGVSANNRLVARNDHACQLADKTAGAVDLVQHKRSFRLVEVLACFQRHDDFLDRGVPCSLANTIDRAFDLIGTVQNSS